MRRLEEIKRIKIVLIVPRTGDSQGLLRGARSDRLGRVERAACAREPTDRMPDSSSPNRNQRRLL
jgi:hypothetical protein